MTYTLIILCMIIQNPEVLIGKTLNNIEDFKEVEASEDNKILGIRRYKSTDKLFFLNETVEQFYFNVDTNNIITEIKFSINKIIYDPQIKVRLIETMGQPEASFCFGEIINSSKMTTPEGFVVSTAVGSKKKCDFYDESVLFTVWKLQDCLYLELTYPRTEATFPRAYIRIAKSSKLLDSE
ncbi:MAG: hypothetical protein WBG71_08060 [Leeuwenhoekiella sp.]